MNVAVLDVGKTNVKAVVVEGSSGREIDARTQPNVVRDDGPYPHYDVDGIFAFLLASLAELRAARGFEAIAITAHGASGVLLGEDGPVLPVLDYEHVYPEAVQAAYDAIRPPFEETFSPRLPGGLNLGAQLHFQKTLFPGAFERAGTVLTYPGYWAWRLTGIVSTEATSLGCHTDLWRPRERRFSGLADRLGIGDRLAPLRRCSDVLGPTTEAITARIGLSRPVPVHAGIHDSNASLLPHLLRREPPFAVVSTGTWVVSFAVGGSLAGLDPTRDTLANVDAFGRAVPSARFMGGREFERSTGGRGAATPTAIARVLRDRVLLTPGIVPGCGPFPNAVHRVVNAPGGLDPDEAFVAASLSAALTTKACLDLTGADGPVIVEGPFAGNRLYASALASAVGRIVLPVPGSTGTSAGAALLAVGTVPAATAGEEAAPGGLPGFEAYRTAWEAAAGVPSGSAPR